MFSWAQESHDPSRSSTLRPSRGDPGAATRVQADGTLR
jgi:hypothetical protein